MIVAARHRKPAPSVVTRIGTNTYLMPEQKFSRAAEEQSDIERGKRLFVACLFSCLRMIAKLGQADY
jgi:hypothetical protein